MARAVTTSVGNRPALGIAQNRVPGLDVFRGVAVMCMVVVHTARVTHVNTNDGLFRARLALFEPAISVTFLWLVGWSLWRSWQRASQSGTSWRRWYRSCALRALTLYSVGVVLFLLQYGVQSPDAWASPDILSTIAWAILVVGLLLPLGTWGLLGGAGALLAVLATVQLERVDISGVNAGPGATVPLVAIACIGACHGLTRNDVDDGRRSNPVLWALGGILCSLVALGLPGELVDQHTSRYTNGSVRFWNHTLRGIAFYGGAVVAAATAFEHSWWLRFQASPWQRAWVAPLSLLGRHALVTYVGHLLALGALDRWLDLPERWSTFVVTSLALLGVFVGIAMMVESERGTEMRRILRSHWGPRRDSNS